MNDYTHHYKKWHSTTKTHVNAMICFYRTEFKKYWPQNKDARVLDVGCGMGFALLAMKEEGYTKLEGVDIDKGQVETARSFGLKVECVEDVVAFLKEREGQYDFVSAIDVIEHVEPSQQIEFVKAIKTSLRGDGCFVCTVPNANSVLAGRWRYIDWTHKTSFTEHSLDFLLSAGGFGKVDVCGIEIFRKYDVPPSWFKRGIEGVLRGFVRGWRRLEMIAELGFDEGRKVPLGVNIVGRGLK